MTPLRDAAVVALAAAAGVDERLVLVTGPAAGRDGDAAEVAEAARNAFGSRVVAVAAAARTWVAAGLVAAGRRVVTVLEAGAPVPADLVSASAGARGVSADFGQHQASRHTPGRAGPVPVFITADVAVADTLLGAGVTVVQPAWPADVAPLLRAALTGDGPVALRLHGGSATASPAGVDPPVLGRPRVLRAGGSVALAASGSQVAVLADVARMLAGRGVAVTAVDRHTFRPGRGGTLALHDGVVLVGGDDDPSRTVPGAARVRRVPATGSARRVMEAILDVVPTLHAPGAR